MASHPRSSPAFDAQVDYSRAFDAGRNEAQRHIDALNHRITDLHESFTRRLNEELADADRRLVNMRESRDMFKRQLTVQEQRTNEWHLAHDEAERKLAEARQQLDAIESARKKIHDSFRQRTPDGKCECAYCRGDAEQLAELAANYELDLYSARCSNESLTGQLTTLREAACRLVAFHQQHVCASEACQHGECAAVRALSVAIADLTTTPRGGDNLLAALEAHRRRNEVLEREHAVLLTYFTKPRTYDLMTCANTSAAGADLADRKITNHVKAILGVA